MNKNLCITCQFPCKSTKGRLSCELYNATKTTILLSEVQYDISSLLSSLADAGWHSGNMDVIRKKYNLE